MRPNLGYPAKAYTTLGLAGVTQVIQITCFLYLLQKKKKIVESIGNG